MGDVGIGQGRGWEINFPLEPAAEEWVEGGAGGLVLPEHPGEEAGDGNEGEEEGIGQRANTAGGDSLKQSGDDDKQDGHGNGGAL